MLSKDSMKNLIPKLVTATVIVVAAICAWLLYNRHQSEPWTRDGQVRADMVQIASRVSGYLINVAVKDNQSVSKGDLLFQIDPSQYQLAVDQARLSLIQAKQSVAQLEAAVRAAEATVNQSQAAATSAKSAIDAAQAGLESAEASVTEAESGVTSANAMIAQVKAQLAEAQREAERQKTRPKQGGIGTDRGGQSGRSGCVPGRS